MGTYSASMGISMTALTIVAVMEVLMIVYSFIDIPLYGPYLWTYRVFYLSLLALAAASIILHRLVRKDMARRYKWLNIANPIAAVFFFAWALGITYFDAAKFHTVDPTVFMTFSLVVPLSFYLYPAVYAMIVIVADIVMLSLTMVVSGSVAPLINISIFSVFQLVLGISFLRLRLSLSERIVEEQDNADIDVMTGFPNRRVCNEDMKRLAMEPKQEDLSYISIDVNGLKEVNDTLGHEAGDKLIIGAAECIEESFSPHGKLYRIGGDEFVVLIGANQDELILLFSSFEKSLKQWSERSGLPLTAAYGYVIQSERPDFDVSGLARLADERIYAAKARFYQASGRDRRGAALGARG